MIAAAASAWDALRQPDPSALAVSATAEAAELPFLSAALRRLLEELPAPGNGLSGTERRALQAVAAGAATPPAAFRAAQDLEAAPFLGDAWFYRTLTSLGHGQARLIETQDSEQLPAAPPLSDARAFATMALRLTPAGERVLRHKADRVQLLGIDRWIGGTHITTGTVWRWDPAAQGPSSTRPDPRPRSPALTGPGHRISGSGALPQPTPCLPRHAGHARCAQVIPLATQPHSGPGHALSGGHGHGHGGAESTPGQRLCGPALEGVGAGRLRAQGQGGGLRLVPGQ